MKLKAKLKKLNDEVFDLKNLDFETDKLDKKTLEIINRLYAKKSKESKRSKYLNKIAQEKEGLRNGTLGIVVPRELSEGEVLLDEKKQPILNKQGEPLSKEESLAILNAEPEIIFQDEITDSKIINSFVNTLEEVKLYKSNGLLAHFQQEFMAELNRIKINMEIYQELLNFSFTFKNVELRPTRYDGIGEKEIIERINSTSMNKEFSHKKLSDLFTVLHRIRKTKQGVKVNLIKEVTVGDKHFRLAKADGFVRPSFKKYNEESNSNIDSKIDEQNQIFNAIKKYFGLNGDDEKEKDNILNFSLQLGAPYSYLHRMNSFDKHNIFINYMVLYLHEAQHEKQFSDFIKFYQSHTMSNSEYAIALTGLFSCFGITKNKTDYDYKLCEMDAYTTSIIQLMEYVDKGYIKLSIEEKINLYGEIIGHLDVYKEKEIDSIIASQINDLNKELSFFISKTFSRNYLNKETVEETISYFKENFTKYDNIRKILEKDIIKFVQPINNLVINYSIKYETNKLKRLDEKLTNNQEFYFSRCNALYKLAEKKLSEQQIEKFKEIEKEKQLTIND